MPRVFVRAICLLTIAGCPVIGLTQDAKSAPRTVETQTISVAGLAAPAQILVDRWGVPHLYAASEDDVFFAQGFNAARDRLFQIDLWRRRGLGRLASVFGPNFVEQDRAARLFLYRGDMSKEWLAYGKNAQRIATRFVAGINAYIDWVGADTNRLPVEFNQFNYLPEKWVPEDMVRIRSHGLTRNVASEFSRATVACRSDLKSDEVRQSLTPPWETKIPAGLDPCMPPEVMRVFTLATQGVLVRGKDEKRAYLGEPLSVAMVDNTDSNEGSNAWVVSPSKSATGRPILASDPHRAYSAPSLRYIVHLNAPGLNVIGGGEPALPGISIGHNGTIAFGLTIFAMDQEDLYVYELNPADAREYKYQGKWERMRTVIESVPVRGGAAVSVDLPFTRHGPVTYVDLDKKRVYAIRSAWFEPGMSPYFGSVEYMYSKNYADFKRAMLKWGAPSENQVYADTAGNIGWVSGGLAPVRPNWDGLLPVPGDGRYEWAGFWPGDKLPSVLNPKSGWFATANELNMPAGYPYKERKLGFEWSPPARYQRIAETLSRLPKVSLEDSMKLQNDVVSISGRRLQAVLRTVTVKDPTAQQALKMLAEWNLMLSGDSAAAALFEIWWSRHLGVVLKDTVLSKNAAALIRNSDTGFVLESMENPVAKLGADGEARRNEIIEKSLLLAWADMVKLAGTDPAVWQWGKLHQTFFPHALANAADDSLKNRLHVGPMPKQGGHDSVNVSSFDAATLRQTAGPTFRMVLDVGNWDESRAVNTPGQSGDPASPHYRDLAPLWLKGEYFPLLYSRPKVDAAVVRRIDLVPISVPAAAK